MWETAGGTRRRLAIAAATAIVAVACGGGAATSAAVPQPTGPTIRIGVLDDTGTSTAIEGAELRVNTDLAVSEINESGGINGRALVPVYLDPRGDAARAIGMAQQLVQQQHVDVLVGGILGPECLGIQNVALRLQTVYLPSVGCPPEDFTGKQCNAYSFRVSPTAGQQAFPLSRYIVNTYGKKWMVVYPDDASGQSLANAYALGLRTAGGELTRRIAIPPNQTSVTSYIAGIPTNGSIAGVIETQTGVDLLRGLTAIQQLTTGKKMPVVGVFGKERWEGTYPDVANGSLAATNALSRSANDNQFDLDYHDAFRRQLAREDPSLLSTLGPVDRAVPGVTGYQAYTTMTALKLGMIVSGFTGRAKPARLITALENLKAGQGADFPGGAFAMRKSDHQGTMTTYIARVNGQIESVVATLPPNGLPAIGNCRVR